jgi:hypothetical protein
VTDEPVGNLYLQEIRRRLRTGRIAFEQAQEMLQRADYVELSDGSMLPPGTAALKHTPDGKIDAEYYKRLAEHFEQRSGRPYTMQMAIGFEARMGKLYEDMTDDDWDRLADKMLTNEQRQETEEGIR